MKNITPQRLLLAVLVAMGALILQKFSSSQNETVVQAEVEDYQMIRPKAFSKPYSLDDRKIDYTFENGKKVAKKSASPVAAKPVAPPVKAPAKKVATAKKKKDTKKAPAVAQATTSQTTEPKDETFVGGTQSPAEGGAFTTGPALQASASDWRHTLFQNPTNENMTKFLNAFAMKEVAEQDFYAIIQELLNDSRFQAQSIALRAISAHPTYESYELLAHYYAEVPKEMQKDAGQIVVSFGEPEHFPLLEKALASTDVTILLQTTGIIDYAAKKAKLDKEKMLDTRDGRGVASGFPSHLYQRFLPILKNLANENDGSVSSAAANLLSALDNLLTPGVS